MFRESVRGVIGIARATRIFQVLFIRPHVLKPSNPQTYKLPNPLKLSSSNALTGFLVYTFALIFQV